jgi:hypothetical protein
MPVCFITGSARSGTTSLLKALGLSGKVQIALEPEPTLNLESRALLDGKLADPFGVLVRDVAPRIARALDRGRVYIEKHVSHVPFIPYLAKLFPCKFLIPVRDGRDVVRSMIDWHNRLFPIIYQECKEPESLGPEARKVRAAQKGPDPFDQSLPRPDRHDPWFESWGSFTRFEMCSWYWNHINRLTTKLLKKVPADQVLIVDYTNPTVESIRRCYEFLELPDFDAQRVEKVLKRKVNSLTERIGEQAAYPKWQEWTPFQSQRFWELAWPAMRELGYVSGDVRPEPPDFGSYWKGREVDPAAYETMYRYRAQSQKQFQAWVKSLDTQQRIERVVEFGSGIGVGSTDLFADRQYVGIDMSPQVVEWANARVRPGHQFLKLDVLKETNGPTGDLVFSHATADNVYDVDAFLRAHARRTSRLLYVSNYRGFFNGLSDHRLKWDPKTGVCFNDLSPARAVEVLAEEGFAAVEVIPYRTGRDDIPIETALVASRRAEDIPFLTAGHDVQFSFAPYAVADAKLPLKGLLDIVNRGCATFSSGGLDLANPLSYFATMVADLKKLPANRSIGTVGAYSRREGSINTAIRVDVDIDLPAAQDMARISGKAGLPITFYLLPTAGYYGYFQGGIFHRHNVCGPIYREMQKAGVEIGLHVDALAAYQLGIDGAQATTQELAWLRECGLTIRGTTGHNAAPVYGAENFEIFAGRAIGGRRCSIKDGCCLPLGVLDATKLGLDYDGSGGGPPAIVDPAARARYLAGIPRGDFLRDPDWLRTYLVDNPYCRWDNDWNIWLLGKDWWAIGGRDSFVSRASWSEVRDFVANLPASERIVLTLHPIYLGQRKAVGSWPAELES